MKPPLKKFKVGDSVIWGTDHSTVYKVISIDTTDGEITYTLESPSRKHELTETYMDACMNKLTKLELALK